MVWIGIHSMRIWSSALPVLFLLILFQGVSFLKAADAPPETIFKLSGWSYGRERKTITSSNRVTATVTVRNISKAPVMNVVATVVYMTGSGEKIAGPVTQKLGSL